MCSLCTSFRVASERFTSLTKLGLVQMALLLGTSVLTTVVLNAAGSYRTTGGSDGGEGGVEPTEGDMKHIDAITLAISLTFTLSTIFGFLYTIQVESSHAFWALVVLQIEQACFVTAAAVGGVLTTPWAKWTVVAANLISIVTFLGLQLVVRKTWGWHAYKAIGGSTDSIRVYQRYQKLAAIVYLDFVHTLFFIIAEEIVIRSSDKMQWALVYGSTVPCLILGLIMMWAVRNDLRSISLSIYCIFAASFGVYVYYTVLNTVGTFTSDYSNLAHHTDFSGRDQAIIVTTIEWCVVVVRAVFLIVSIRVASSGTFKHLLGSHEVDEARGRATGGSPLRSLGGSHLIHNLGDGGGERSGESRYLINPSEMDHPHHGGGTRTMSSMASTARLGLGGTVRQVAVIDTTIAYQGRSASELGENE